MSPFKTFIFISAFLYVIWFICSLNITDLKIGADDATWSPDYVTDFEEPIHVTHTQTDLCNPETIKYP